MNQIAYFLQKTPKFFPEGYYLPETLWRGHPSPYAIFCSLSLAPHSSYASGPRPILNMSCISQDGTLQGV